MIDKKEVEVIVGLQQFDFKNKVIRDLIIIALFVIVISLFVFWTMSSSIEEYSWLI